MGAHQAYLAFQKRAADDVVELPYAVAHPYEYAQNNKEKRFYEGLQHGAMHGALTGAAIGAQRPSVGRFLISVPVGAGVGAALLSHALPRIEEKLNWLGRDWIAREYEASHGPLPSAIRHPQPFTPEQHAYFEKIVADYRQQLQKRADFAATWQAVQPHLPQLVDTLRDVGGTLKGLKDTGAATYAKALGSAGKNMVKTHGLGSTAASMAGRALYDGTPTLARPAVGKALAGAGNAVKRWRGADSPTGNALHGLGDLIKDTPKGAPVGGGFKPPSP